MALWALEGSIFRIILAGDYFTQRHLYRSHLRRTLWASGPLGDARDRRHESGGWHALLLLPDRREPPPDSARASGGSRPSQAEPGLREPGSTLAASYAYGLKDLIAVIGELSLSR